MNKATEILINASHITHNLSGDSYEFIINQNLEVLDSIKVTHSINEVESLKKDINNFEDMLFELGHVRVNPKLDNKEVVNALIEELNKSGISVNNPPHQNSMSICFKPLGEITSSVRFYINYKNKLVFLSPMQPKLVCAAEKKPSKSIS